MTTVQSVLHAANCALRDSGIVDAARDTRRLMAACLDIAPDRLLMHTQEPIGEATEAAFAAMVQLRLGRMPVSRILGTRAFYGRDFKISPKVLDPRPETEVLIAQALAVPYKSVLDLGTGSGAIAVTLLAEVPKARALASDISPDALAVASDNGHKHGVADRLGLVESNWWSQIDGQFDLVVSNPPYIAADEMADLSPDVADHDPRIALTDDNDGLDAYRAILRDVRSHLVPGGRVLVEIGPTQGRAVSALMADAGLCEIKVVHDFDGRDRVVCGKNA